MTIFFGIVTMTADDVVVVTVAARLVNKCMTMAVMEPVAVAVIVSVTVTVTVTVTAYVVNASIIRDV